MKMFAVCGVICAVGFFATAMQLGLLGNQRVEEGLDEPALVEKKAEKKAKPVRALFPDELAPAAKAQPVPVAAAFQPGDRPHKIVFFKATGELHPWHELVDKYDDDWYARKVEETELVIVLGNSRRTEVQVVRYPNAPAVSRFRYDLEASLIEAKTGTVLANQQFANVPRLIRSWEPWSLTAIGEPVSYRTVFRWASGIAKVGPPSEATTAPIFTTID